MGGWRDLKVPPLGPELPETVVTGPRVALLVWTRLEFSAGQFGWVVSVSSPGWGTCHSQAICWIPLVKTVIKDSWTMHCKNSQPPGEGVELESWSWILGEPWGFCAERLPGGLWGCWERYQMGTGLALGYRMFYSVGKSSAGPYE